MKFIHKIDGNVISATQDFIDKLENKDDYEVYVPEVKTSSFEELKTKKLLELKIKYDNEYEEYLNSFPKPEVATFDDRSKEAIAYIKNDAEQTPLINASLGAEYTEEQRAIEINAVYNKALFVAKMGGMARDLRNSIESCVSVEELEQINW